MIKNKYKGCSLPVVDNWKVYMDQLYYTNFPDESSIRHRVENVGSLYEGFSDVINYGLYYSFNTKLYKVNDEKEVWEVGPSHAHSFEAVIREVYDNPESFSIDESDYELYSKQELIFLNRLKSFLLIIGLKDRDYPEEGDVRLQRARNARAKELSQYRQKTFKEAKAIISGKLKKLVTRFISDRFIHDEKYIVIDEEGNYLGIVDVKKEKRKLDDITSDDIDFKLLGYDSIEAYKKFIGEKYFDTSSSDKEKYVVVESYELYEKF